MRPHPKHGPKLDQMALCPSAGPSAALPQEQPKGPMGYMALGKGRP